MNHFPNTFAVSLNPMRGCDIYQISIHIARMEQVKQLAALAAALLQLMLLPLPLLLLLHLLLLLLPLLLLPCPPLFMPFHLRCCPLLLLLLPL